jgi:uroporphyrin-III C-methyltransferase
MDAAKSAIGRVYLVGAGPGDPELLTVKAHNLLRSAETVLHDDLVSPAILALASPEAEIVNVGKRAGAKGITQAEINALMIDAARRGLALVRLKSGDPGIFGRLAEEMDALEAAGIPFEVVPGVTAGVAAAASLRVSLTDRRNSARIVVVTNHHAQGTEPRQPTDWAGLVRDDVTLIIYMPGRDFGGLAAELMAAGMSADVPAVIVSSATTADQNVCSTSLAQLHAAPHMESPAVLLIGRALDSASRRYDADAAALALDEANLILASL